MRMKAARGAERIERPGSRGTASFRGHRFSRLFLVHVAVCCGWVGRTAETAPPHAPQYILFLTADGFRTDYIEWYVPPHLKQLIAEGVRVSNVTNVFPTVTTANMASLVTGAYPRTTGIAANAQYVKEADRIVRAPRANAAETIAEMLHRAGWMTAGVNHFMLQGTVDAYIAPGYADAEKTTDAIIGFLKKGERTFVAAIYGATDHAGHQFGPRSREMSDAVLGIDRAVGRLVESLKALGIYERTVITFNADHGMSAFEDKQAASEPAVALAHAGFRVATDQAGLNAATQIVVLDAGVRLVYFRALPSPADRQKAETILSGIAGTELLRRGELDRLGCHDNRSGDIIVSPLPGYTMSNAGGKGGLHGRFTERNPVLFFRGPGMRQGVTLEAARTIDVVPTLLKSAGVQPAPTVDGTIIPGAFQD